MYINNFIFSLMNIDFLVGPLYVSSVDIILDLSSLTNLNFLVNW